MQARSSPAKAWYHMGHQFILGHPASQPSRTILQCLDTWVPMLPSCWTDTGNSEQKHPQGLCAHWEGEKRVCAFSHNTAPGRSSHHLCILVSQKALIPICNTFFFQMPEAEHQTLQPLPLAGDQVCQRDWKPVWIRDTPPQKLNPHVTVQQRTQPICPGPFVRGRFSGGAGGMAMGAILGTCGSHNGLWVLGGETDWCIVCGGGGLSLESMWTQAFGAREIDSFCRSQLSFKALLYRQ